MKSYRVQSLDLLRGLVMIIMALDHVRDYFHADAFLYDPTDLSKTSVVLFFTRWITHYCAPAFIFLSGTSAFLVGHRKGKKELSMFLIKRGVWLIFLELVVLNFGWFFNFHFPMPSLIVIWAIGVGFLILAAIIHLPFNAILSIGLVLIFGHNAFDGFQVQGNGMLTVMWSIIHQPGVFPIDSTHLLFVGYPLIPWIGVMMVGYCLGSLYIEGVDSAYRKRLLVYFGSASILLFVVIRFINIYGDADPWSVQPTLMYTFLSFLNVSKYPPSLLYVLMTLGPVLLFLSLTENATERSITKRIIVFGRVPMFYYILHIYIIHIMASVAAVLSGYSISTMVFNTWITNSAELKGYGFSLPVTYLIWMSLVLVLYPLCYSYNRYKTQHPEKIWLSYL